MRTPSHPTKYRDEKEKEGAACRQKEVQYFAFHLETVFHEADVTDAVKIPPQNQFAAHCQLTH